MWRRWATDAKIPDQMPFYNTFRYVPTEISIATGGYDQRGTLFAWAIIVNKDNPITQLSMDQSTASSAPSAPAAGSRRHRGQQSCCSPASTRAAPRPTSEPGASWALPCDWADRPIQTYGYVRAGFATNFERTK